MLLDDVRLCVRGDGRAPSFFGWAYFLDAAWQLSLAPRSPTPFPPVGLVFAKSVVKQSFPWLYGSTTCCGYALGTTCRPVAEERNPPERSGVSAIPGVVPPARMDRMCRTPMRTCVRDHRLDRSHGAPPLAATTRMRISVIRVRVLGDSGSPLRALRYPCARDHRTGRIPIRYPRAPTGSECGLLALHESSFRGRQVSGNKSDEIVGERDDTVPGIGR